MQSSTMISNVNESNMVSLHFDVFPNRFATAS